MADYLPLRLPPGADLRAALLEAIGARDCRAAFVVAGIGSLAGARLRLAGAAETSALTGDLEILSVSGTLGEGGAHLHMAVADAQGRVTGGHVAEGCIVRTTAELLLALLPGQRFVRETDPATGYLELAIRPR
jgi:predicted DNA-binding protein with PD1-like motif